MGFFTKKFRTFDPHLPIVWDKVLKNNVFFDTFPYQDSRYIKTGNVFAVFNLFNSFRLWGCFSILPLKRFQIDITLWSLRVQDNVAGGREDEEVQLSLTVSWIFLSEFLKEKKVR